MDSIHGLKSWTILPRSLRILPPKLDDLDVDGAGQAHGSLCPGHFIPTKTKHWNKVLNRDGPLPYPGDMGLIRQEQWHMSWQFSNGHNLGISAKAGAPVVGPVPVTVNGEAEIAFKKTVTDAYRFDKLETYIIEPIEPYIGQSLKHPGIDTYIKDNTNMLGHWNVFMVTGVIVARGATMSSDETRTRQFGLGGGAGVPGVAEASAKIDIGANRQLSTSAGKINDFIWAIQLARVRKGFGRKTWDWETLWFKKSDGSTFTNDPRERAKQQFRREVAASDDESIVKAELFGLDDSDNFFIFPADKQESGDNSDIAQVEGGAERS